MNQNNLKQPTPTIAKLFELLSRTQSSRDGERERGDRNPTRLPFDLFLIRGHPIHLPSVRFTQNTSSWFFNLNDFFLKKENKIKSILQMPEAILAVHVPPLQHPLLLSGLLQEARAPLHGVVHAGECDGGAAADSA